MSDFFAEQPAGASQGGGPGGARPPGPPARGPRRPRPLLLTLVVVGVLVVGFSLFAGIWADKLWFGSLGYGSVFSKLIWTRVILFAIFGGAMALIVGVNLFLAFRLRPMFRPHSPEQANLERYREVVTPLRRVLLVGVSVVFGIFAGVSATGKWRIVPAVEQRRGLRQGRPVLRQGHRLLRLQPAVAALPRRLRDDRAVHGAHPRCGRALPLRRHPAAVRLRPGVRRGPGAALRAVRAVPAAQGRRLLARPVRPDLAGRQPDHRDDLHPGALRAAGEEHPDVHRGDLCPAVLRQHRPAHVAAPRRGTRPVRRLGGAARWRLARSDAALPGQARRAGQGSVVHQQEHPGDQSGVRPGGHDGHRVRRQPLALAEPAQQRRQVAARDPPRRPAAGLRDLRAAPAGPWLLQRAVGARRRPLQHRRPRARRRGGRARAAPRGSARRPEEVGQREDRLHPRLRPDRRLRQPAQRRGPAGEQRRRAGVRRGGPAAPR